MAASRLDARQPQVQEFYFISEEMFEKLIGKWDRAKDGPKFAAYVGLLFSEMDRREPIVSNIQVAQASDGQDGNCAVDPDVWGDASCQFRAMQLDGDGLPVALGKGICTSVKDAQGIQLNDSQIKWSGSGKFVILRNKDASQVHQVLARRAKDAVAELLSLD